MYSEVTDSTMVDPSELVSVTAKAVANSVPTWGFPDASVYV